MAAEVRLWRVSDAEQLIEIGRTSLDLESRLQAWLVRDISILDPALMVIGREVETDFGGFIDLLCIDAVGDLIIVELKRDRTPREVTAQALDYASWVTDLSNDDVTAIANGYLGEGFESVFRTKFGLELPETLNADHRILVVGSEIDASSERIMRYLSDVHGVNINAATFHYFRPQDGSELLARVFVLKPSEVELKTRTKGSSKRRPRLDRDELLSSFDASSEDKAAVVALLEWATEHPNLTVTWRAAADIDVPGRVSQLLRIWPSGRWPTGAIEVRLRSLKDFDSRAWDAERCDQLIRRLEASTGLHFDKTRSWPKAPIAPLADPHKRQFFLEIIEGIVGSLNLPA